jgi:preprotein translocase subunit SecB
MMENFNGAKSGFKIDNVILTESNFKRISNAIFDDKVQNKMEINVGVGVKDNSITVEETVRLKQIRENIEQYSFNVKMVGLFKHIGDSEISDMNQFGKVNGAAIIFPYIREYITNISQKAGIGVVILPPVNFIELGKEKK